MSRRSKIKWRESDKKLLSQRVRIFNSKRARLIKQLPELEEILPKKQSVRELKKNIETRNDFKKTINKLNRFMKPDATKIVVTQEGVRTTRYQIREIAINVRIINAQRKRLRERANVSTEKGTMGTIGKSNLNPKKNNSQAVSKSSWDDYVKLLDKQIFDKYYTNKEVLYKRNFMKGLKEAFSGVKGYRELKKLFDSFTPEEITDMYYEDSTMQLDFIYGPEEAEVRIAYLKEHAIKWKNENSV